MATEWGLLDQLAAEAGKAERHCVRLLHALGYPDEDLDSAVQSARRDLYDRARLEAARRRDEADDSRAPSPMSRRTRTRRPERAP